MEPKDLQAIACWCVKERARRLRLQAADMDDLRQDVLVALLRAVPKHKPERSPMAAFLFFVGRRAAHRAVESLLRDKQRAGVPIGPGVDVAVPHRWAEDDRDEVAYLLHGLAPHQRATIEACFFRGERMNAYSASRGKHRNLAANVVAQATKRMRLKAGRSRG